MKDGTVLGIMRVIIAMSLILVTVMILSKDYDCDELLGSKHLMFAVHYLHPHDNLDADGDGVPCDSHM